MPPSSAITILPLSTTMVCSCPGVTGVPLISLIVTVSPSTSLSLLVKLTVIDVSSFVVKLSGFATGASLIGVTWIVTVDVAVLSPSVMV